MLKAQMKYKGDISIKLQQKNQALSFIWRLNAMSKIK
jgi:hypothetical protein